VLVAGVSVVEETVVTVMGGDGGADGSVMVGAAGAVGGVAFMSVEGGIAASMEGVAGESDAATVGSGVITEEISDAAAGIDSTSDAMAGSTGVSGGESRAPWIGVVSRGALGPGRSCAASTLAPSAGAAGAAILSSSFGSVPSAGVELELLS
jgi:hypothetical protein